jgi:hypothetical protein
MKKGTTRVVYLIGRYAIKMPRINSWKSFLRGFLANLDERMWYKNSPPLRKEKMCPSLMSLFGGFVLISRRATPISKHTWDKGLVKKEDFSPLPLDLKQINFGWYKHKIVLIDYADSKYFCSDCEKIFDCLMTLKKENHGNT